ncbi:diguanylate cyclase [Pseudomonas anguilliseptica]|uniref:diguanylate cyclase n=1 Tax=Pseudomonas anguilliseptica TaxID=53406 RepID=UPI003735BECE
MKNLLLDLSLSHSPESNLRPIAKRLLAWVLVISASNALLAISVQLYLDYQRDRSDLSEHLDFVLESHQQGLSTAIWNFDRPLIEAQLDGLVGSPWVTAAKVAYGKNESHYLVRGEVSDDGIAPSISQLQFSAGPRTVDVGRLYLWPNFEHLYQRTFDRALVVALTQGLKAFVISLAILWLVHHLVTRRLVRLGEVLRTYRPSSNIQLQLLTPDDIRLNDELTMLARTLEDAQQMLDEYHRREHAEREHLEAVVQRRTQHLDQALLEHQAIFDNSLTGIAFIRDRTIERCNRSFEQLFGYSSHELGGKSTRVLFPTQEAFEQEAASFAPVLLRGGTYMDDVELIRKDGTTRWFTVQFKLLDSSNTAQGAVLTLHDVTARRETELAMERLARLDGLTGIANRRTLDEALQTACRKASRERGGLSVALIDVDCFKHFNDHYGHAAGDAALRAVATTLGDVAKRPYDLAARYGGEEFVLLLPGSEAPFPLLEKLRLAILELAIPHAHSSAGERVSVSIGVISICGRSHCEPDELLAAADTLLYRAKREGRNRVIWQHLQTSHERIES